MSTLFITGTDTGVGKTTVSCAIAAALSRLGHGPGVMKPIETGCGPALEPADARRLVRAAGVGDPLELVCPQRFAAPLAPAVAAEMEGRPVDLVAIRRAHDTLAERHAMMLVEGAGGIMVPLTETLTMLDLIRQLGASVLVVARAGLGTLNHTLLTVRTLRAEGLRVVGLVLNRGPGASKDLAEATNAQELVRRTGLPVWGTLPALEGPVEEMSPEALAELAEAHLDLRAIAAALALADRRGRALALECAAKRHLWHPFTQMAEFVAGSHPIIEYAEGATLTDVEGVGYLDGNASMWLNVHGHRHPAINQAITAQLGRLEHATMLGMSNVPAIELAERLVAIAPSGLTRVFYSDNGSTAVEAALKMAFQFWRQAGRPEKRRFAALTGAYHGDTLGSVSVGGIGTFHGVFGPLLFEVERVDAPHCYRCPLGKHPASCHMACFEALEALFARSGHELAALVLEPLVQGAAGIQTMPRGFLARARALCDAHEVLLILDEVATGFGRTGTMFACEQEGVAPDLMALAKGLSGGYLPLAATLATERVYEAFLGGYEELKTFFHGHSYTGNPLGCAAALASLELFERERTLECLAPKIVRLSERLAGLARASHVGDVRQVGFVAGVELVRDRASRTPYAWEERIGLRVCEEARRHGVILRPIGNVIVLMPPLAIAEHELERLLDVLEAAIAAITGAAQREPGDAG